MARRLRLRFVSDADAKQLMVNRRIEPGARGRGHAESNVIARVGRSDWLRPPTWPASLGRASGRRQHSPPTWVQKRQSLDSGSDSASHSDPEGDEDKKKGICEVKDKKFAGNEIPNQVLPSCSRLTQAEQGDVQNYFEAHRSSKVCTSNRTLSCLRSAHLDQDRLLGLLADLPPVFLKERQVLKEGYRHLFSKWLLQLRLGFNVLLYGLGSKRCLLDDFRLTALHDESHVVLDGSFPNVTLNSVLTLILEEILELPVPRTSVEQLEAVKRSFGTEGACELFLLVHNVDGPTLRASRTQEWFAQLATLPGIHIIATIDHVNAPLVWDQGRAGQFRWLWFDVPTFEAYTEETAYEKSLLVHSSGTLVLSSLRHVLRSLTPNARGIFALLAQYQLKHKDTTSYPGLSFQSCYQQCREAFLVSSDIALRAQLTEFLDHRLVRTKKGSDGVEYLSIPIDTSTLRDFLDSQKET